LSLQNSKIEDLEERFYELSTTISIEIRRGKTKSIDKEKLKSLDSTIKEILLYYQEKNFYSKKFISNLLLFYFALKMNAKYATNSDELEFIADEFRVRFIDVVCGINSIE